MMRLRFALVIALAAADCPPTAAPVAGSTVDDGGYRRRLTAGCLTDIAGYAPETDVDQHAYIDLDMNEMLGYLEDTTVPDYTSATTICASRRPLRTRFPLSDSSLACARRRERRQLGQGLGLPHAPELRAEGPCQ